MGPYAYRRSLAQFRSGRRSRVHHSCRRRRLAVSPSRLVASLPRHLVALPPRLARRLVAAVPDRHLSRIRRLLARISPPALNLITLSSPPPLCYKKPDCVQGILF